ncbi:MAG: esterase YqiA [Vibrio sp.]
MTKPSMLLYLHGFHSSPLSHKAVVMRDYCQQHRPDIRFECPQLPYFPKQAAELVRNLVLEYQDEYQIGLVGSSLGGYLSTWLNHEFDLPAVLVNPAIKPYDLLHAYLGEQCHPYTQENYVLELVHMDELKALEVEQILRPHMFWLLLQTQDEVLDYRQALHKFDQSPKFIEEGGDHSFVGFERFPQKIIQFLAL